MNRKDSPNMRKPYLFGTKVIILAGEPLPIINHHS
jgi:hypothetical protein